MASFVEVIMRRVFVSATLFLVPILAAPADDRPGPKGKKFARDVEKLNGSWTNPKIQLAG